MCMYIFLYLIKKNIKVLSGRPCSGMFHSKTYLVILWMCILKMILKIPFFCVPLNFDSWCILVRDSVWSKYSQDICQTSANENLEHVWALAQTCPGPVQHPNKSSLLALVLEIYNFFSKITEDFRVVLNVPKTNLAWAYLLLISACDYPFWTTICTAKFCHNFHNNWNNIIC